MSEDRRPYIGITGFMTQDEVRAAIADYREAWAATGREPTHDLMVGVLASSKTLCGHANKYPRKYPSARDINNIWVDDPIALNLVHVCVGDMGPSTVDGKNIPVEVDVWRGIKAGGDRCHGIQLNSTGPTWQKVMDVANICRSYKAPRLVLQAGLKWLENRLAGSNELIMFGGASDFLIDGSGGRGRVLDPAYTMRMIDCATVDMKRSGAQDGEIRFGVAGGLCAETVGSLLPIFRAHPRTSIDAEGRIRDDAPDGGNLDPMKRRAYLQAAVAMIVEATDG